MVKNIEILSGLPKKYYPLFHIVKEEIILHLWFGNYINSR